MTPAPRFSVALSFVLLVASPLLAASLSVSEPLVIHEEAVPPGFALPSNPQLVAGRDTFLLVWLAGGGRWAGTGPYEWLGEVLSPEGRPLRAERLRLRADMVRIIRSGDGFAAIARDETSLVLHRFDAMGNSTAEPRTVYESGRGYGGIVAASNGRQIVVAWTEKRERNWEPPLIRGIMIHPDGRIEEGIIRDTAPQPSPSDPWSSALSIGSDGVNFLVGWNDCLKSGTRFYTLYCSVSSRMVVTAGPELLGTVQLTPPGRTYAPFLGPTASNGAEWTLVSQRGLFLLDGVGSPLCSQGSDDPFAPLIDDPHAQLTWDGRTFILVRREPNYGGSDIRVARLLDPCGPPSAEGTLGAGGSYWKQFAAASLGDGSTLIAYTEMTDFYSAEVPDDVRIIVQRVMFRDESRSRPVRR
jgi:hypothetical protein